MFPKCPYCGEVLDYDEQLETNYGDTTFSTKWRGYCDHCQIGFTWWENYILTSIDDMEQEELE